jgi:hypothetical protein
MNVLNYPLSNTQVELMKLFSTNLTETELIELKELLSAFYAKKAINQADSVWMEKGLSNEDMDNWLKNS